jgi:hypothetical protein
MIYLLIIHNLVSPDQILAFSMHFFQMARASGSTDTETITPLLVGSSSVLGYTPRASSLSNLFTECHEVNKSLRQPSPRYHDNTFSPAEFKIYME